MVYSFSINGRRTINLLFKTRHSKCISSSSTNNVKVLFFGSDKFSLGTLEALNEMRLEGGIITQLDVVSSAEIRYIKKKKQLITPPVISYANTHNLKTLSWVKVKKDGFEEYDIGVVASFGDFIPGRLLSLIKRGAINIHPSLLPRWRGPAPIIHTILAGDKLTGISVIDVSKKKFDVGNILYQKEYTVPPLCTSDDLLTFLTVKSKEIIPYVMNNIEDLKRNTKVQSDTLSIHAPKINKATGYIDFAKHSSSYLQRLQLALPEKIGIQARYNGKNVQLGKILDIMDTSPCEHDLPIGGCWFDKNKKKIWIRVINSWISISWLKVEYKNEISAAGFYNGYIVDNQTGRPNCTNFENIPSTDAT